MRVGGEGSVQPNSSSSTTNLLLPEIQRSELSGIRRIISVNGSSGYQGTGIGSNGSGPGLKNVVCPTSASSAGSGMVVANNGLCAHSPLVGVGGENIMIHTTAAPALNSSPANSEAPNGYNGIFLVDGFGQGVRVDGSHKRTASGLSNDPTHPSLHQYGLPSLVSQPGMPMDMSAKNCSALMPNPVCIRIDGQEGSQSDKAHGAIIPIQGTTTVSHVSNVVPKCNSGGNRNSVTLPVPSPTHAIPQGNSLSHLFPLQTTTPVMNSGMNSGINSGMNQGMNSGITSGMSSMNVQPHRIGIGMQTSPSPITVVSSPEPSPILAQCEFHEKSQMEVVGDSGRTLISTEAQTEDLPALAPPPPPSRNREQRKRERRERRRADRSHSQTNTSPNMQTSRHSTALPPQRQHRHVAMSPNICQEDVPPPGTGINIPDLLNSHLPPPYSTLPQNCERRVGLGSVPIPVIGPPPNCPPQFPPPLLPGPPPNCLPSPPQPVRYHFSPNVRASRRSLRAPRGIPYASEEEPKSCCGMSTSQAVSIRWFIIVIAVIGICCTVAGTALGAARSAGNQHLTLSLLMIGVGVVLLTVSAVAWRLTANESGTSCRAMLGFARSGSSRGDGGAEPNRRFVPRLAPSYGRPHHPYAAMMYPDFQYRPPPPSYQASMQEYRLRLLLLERSNPTIAAAATLASPSAMSMVPPPPAYRPYNGTLRPGNCRPEHDFSRPPSYRSRGSGQHGNHYDPNGSVASRPSLDPSGIAHCHLNGSHRMLDSPLHSRNPSLLSYLSQQSIQDNGSAVSGSERNQNNVVIQAVGMNLGLDMRMGYSTTGESGEDGRKDHPSLEDVDGFGDEKKTSKDGNLVRIVQTTDSSQVIGRDSVIVTVSGSNHALWDQSLQEAAVIHHQQLNQHHRNNSNGMRPGQSGPSDQTNNNSEVQILAHL